MTIMKLLGFFFVAMFLSIGSAQSATYRYTGQEYDTISNLDAKCDLASGYQCVGSYTPGMRLVVEFVHEGLLQADTVYSLYGLSGGSYVNDGLLENGGRVGGSPGAFDIDLKTDDAGRIVSWSTSIFFGSSDYAFASSSSISGDRVGHSYLFATPSAPGCNGEGDVNLRCVGFAEGTASTSKIGSWAVVPVPASLYLLVGAFLMSGMVLRRKN
jgi:hypothetical protein